MAVRGGFWGQIRRLGATDALAEAVQVTLGRGDGRGRVPTDHTRGDAGERDEFAVKRLDESGHGRGAEGRVEPRDNTFFCAWSQGGAGIRVEGGAGQRGGARGEHVEHVEPGGGTSGSRHDAGGAIPN